MSKKFVVLVALLSFTALSFAQVRNSELSEKPGFSTDQYLVQPLAAKAASPVLPATTTCAKTYSSGTGDAKFTFCITVNGNIVQLSRAGFEMIRVGQVGEGYGICDFTSGAHYFDYAYTDSGNLLGSTLTFPNATTAVSSRISSDGIWQFTSTITNVPATPQAVGRVTLKTVVKNLTGISRNIFFLRWADVDADGSTGNNDFDWDINSATAMFAPKTASDFGHGLALFNNTFNLPTGFHNNYSLNTFNGPDPCSPFTNISTQPFHGDGSVMSLDGTVSVAPGGTRAFIVTYHPL